MHLFYEPDILVNPILNEEDSYHAQKVLRLTKNHAIHITNGKGSLLHTKIAEVGKRIKVEVLNNQYFAPPNYYIHIAIAPTKNMDRIEWMVEKCTEIGIQEFSFINCKNSERKELKINRLERIAIAAMKQSKQNWLPKINAMTDIKSFLNFDFTAFQKYVAFVDAANTTYLAKTTFLNAKYLVCIGPEGDFTIDELNDLINKKFTKVSLGHNILRTETAGVVACNILNTINL